MSKFFNYKNNVINQKVMNMRRNWYKFSRNQLSVYGLIIVCLVLFIAIFAPIISPYPESTGKYINFLEASKPPSTTHLFGTDIFGRDVLTRILFGYRLSLIMAAVVLSIVVPIGVILGLIAGYFRDTSGSRCLQSALCSATW